MRNYVLESAMRYLVGKLLNRNMRVISSRGTDSHDHNSDFSDISNHTPLWRGTKMAGQEAGN